ncbi:uncharacterized protein DUF4262 [Hephaestia caeni]|uniref:Uncharacterized protein DUF4262 n=1 Tax=Hephaestia caeni TaxID=645617 RepID=A0A397PJV2_9SPHN|nr:DUF4262 domain-containing protein [Hephaestia caeni]RIA46424.1 uncharacterized protein DUF4262 [Hephaestia caeni]
MFTSPDTLNTLRETIDHNGQAEIAVVTGAGTPCFAHTIGNANHGLPELLAIGAFMPGRILQILAQIGHGMRKAGMAPDSEIDLGRTYPIRTRLAGPVARSRYTTDAGAYLGHDKYTVIQLLFADPSGRYPGEPGCDPRYDVQLI